MATQPESKIDAAAEKAYAEASAARKAEAKADAPKPAATPAAAKAEAPKPAVKKAPAKVKKAPAKKVAAKKPVAKKAAAKPAAKKAVAPKVKPAPKTTKTAPKSTPKDTVMTKAKTTAADYATKLKEGLADLQARAKTAYDKGAEYATEMREFSKGNLEATVESGKILAAGVQDMAKAAMEDGKSAVETMTADAKEFAAIKSPTEFVQLQGKIASRNFDAAIAQMSKSAEAWVKLGNDVAAPLSGRVSLAMEKVRKAA